MRRHAGDIISRVQSARPRYVRPGSDATTRTTCCDTFRSFRYFSRATIFLDLWNRATFCADICQRFSDNELVVTCSWCARRWLLNFGRWTDVPYSREKNTRRDSDVFFFLPRAICLMKQINLRRTCKFSIFWNSSGIRTELSINNQHFIVITLFIVKNVTFSYHVNLFLSCDINSWSR